MSNTTVDENYKGIFQEYCYARNLGEPVYESSLHGYASEPVWSVTIRYGQSVYTTPNPVHGAKRLAEQIAARQLLEQIESRQEAFLAGEPFDQLPDSEAPHLHQPVASHSEILVHPPSEPLHVSVELITTALEIANNHLAESGQSARLSQSSDKVFAQDLANLTIAVVRELAKSDAEANTRLISSEEDEPPPM